MSDAPGRLTDEQVRSSYFIVPDFGILLLGDEFYARYAAQRDAIERTGGGLYVIGWPDGMTVSMHVVDDTKPIDLDDLLSLYRAATAVYRAAGMWGVE